MVIFFFTLIHFFTVDLVGKYNGEIFETRSVTYSLGEGSEFGVCEGIEIALEKFSKGEQAKLEIKSKYAFKKEGRSDLNIPPNADVEYEVTLKNFEKVCLAYGNDNLRPVTYKSRV